MSCAIDKLTRPTFPAQRTSELWGLDADAVYSLDEAADGVAVDACGQKSAVAGLIVTGEVAQYVPGGAPLWIEFFVDLTEEDDGGSLQVIDFQVRVELSGSNAGTDASIIDVDETVNHPQASPLFLDNVESPTRAFGRTFNLGPPFTLHDEVGLMRVNLQFDAAASGTYTLAILTGSEDTQLLHPSNNQITFTTQDAQITTVPEPGSLLLSMVVATGMGGCTCLRRIQRRRPRQIRS